MNNTLSIKETTPQAGLDGRLRQTGRPWCRGLGRTSPVGPFVPAVHL